MYSSCCSVIDKIYVKIEIISLIYKERLSSFAVSGIIALFSFTDYAKFFLCKNLTE
jgi:hypothetical protein